MCAGDRLTSVAGELTLGKAPSVVMASLQERTRPLELIFSRPEDGASGGVAARPVVPGQVAAAAAGASGSISSYHYASTPSPVVVFDGSDSPVDTITGGGGGALAMSAEATGVISGVAGLEVGTADVDDDFALAWAKTAKVMGGIGSGSGSGSGSESESESESGSGSGSRPHPLAPLVSEGIALSPSHVTPLATDPGVLVDTSLGSINAEGFGPTFLGSAASGPGSGDEYDSSPRWRRIFDALMYAQAAVEKDQQGDLTGAILDYESAVGLIHAGGAVDADGKRSKLYRQHAQRYQQRVVELRCEISLMGGVTQDDKNCGDAEKLNACGACGSVVGYLAGSDDPERAIAALSNAVRAMNVQTTKLSRELAAAQAEIDELALSTSQAEAERDAARLEADTAVSQSGTAGGRVVELEGVVVSLLREVQLEKDR